MAIHVDRFLEKFVTWAKAEDQISVVILVGSQARHTAGLNSDIDLVILCNSPDTFIRDRAWVKIFGDVRKQQIETWGKLTAVRVYYKDATEVEFGFAEPSWAGMPLDAGTRAVLAGGFKILFDRDGKLTELEKHV